MDSEPKGKISCTKQKGYPLKARLLGGGEFGGLPRKLRSAFLGSLFILAALSLVGLTVAHGKKGAGPAEPESGKIGSSIMPSQTKTKPNDPDRFLAVKTFRLVVDWYASKKKVDKIEKGSTTYQVALTAHAVFRLERSEFTPWSWDNGATMKVQGSLDQKSLYLMETTDPKYYDKRKVDIAGLQLGVAKVLIRPKENDCLIAGTASTLDGGIMTIESTDAPRQTARIPRALRITASKQEAGESTQGLSFPLPASGLVITGQSDFEDELYPFNGEFGEDAPVEKVRVKWRLSPWDEEEEGPAKIRLVDDKWLPEPDNEAKVKATWTKGTATALKFTLYDISKQPGSCMNSKSSDEEPDFSIENPAGFRVKRYGDSWEADAVSILPEDKEMSLSIKSHDGGGWAKVKCEVKINGKWVTADDPAGGKYLVIPKDDDGDHIGDAWAQTEQVAGDSVDSDDEKSGGNGHDGDGFTLYEEYRGLMAQGTFSRLHPKRKDLCVVVAPGMEGVVSQGVTLFAKAADVEKIQLLKDEVDANVTINFRKNTVAYGGAQHGLIIRVGDTGDADGLTVPRKSGAKYTSKPGDVLFILVSANLGDFVTNFGAGAIVKDVAHELGHACGAKHHGDSGSPVLNSNIYGTGGNIVITAAAKDYVILDAKGQEILKRPFTIPRNQRIGFDKGTPAGGDVGCIMCYDSVFSWSYRSSEERKYLANKLNIAPGTSFCSSAAGTGYNGKNNKPYPLFGDADTGLGRGNCKGMLRIKDWGN